MTKPQLPCGVSIGLRPRHDPRYMLVCAACGKDVDCYEHRNFIESACSRLRCKPLDLAYCCADCKAIADATLVNPLNFGRA